MSNVTFPELNVFLYAQQIILILIYPVVWIAQQFTSDAFESSVLHILYLLNHSILSTLNSKGLSQLSFSYSSTEGPYS